MTYEISLREYTGPLDKLLELIETKELEITAITIASVTADFIDHLQKSEEDIDPSILADFLVVAAKLVLLKSKVLLPSLSLNEDEEADIKDLEMRLLIYKEFSARGGKETSEQSASNNISSMWANGEAAHVRSFLALFGQQTFFVPATNISIANLSLHINKIAEMISVIAPPEPEKVKSKIISLKEKIQELLTRFRDAAQHSFASITMQKTRSEVIALFLAVLHLFREHSIHIEQEEHFGDIVLKRKEQKTEN